MSSKDEQSLAAAVAEVTAAARVSGMPDINELQDARAALAREDRVPLPIGVLLSGSGTNLQALIDAIDEQGFEQFEQAAPAAAER